VDILGGAKVTDTRTYDNFVIFVRQYVQAYRKDWDNISMYNAGTLNNSDGP